jgi:hypothetical protein
LSSACLDARNLLLLRIVWVMYMSFSRAGWLRSDAKPA